MSYPFNMAGTLSFPQAPGVPSMPIPFGMTGQYNNEAAGSPFTLTGTGTHVVDLGTVPSAGLVGMLVMVDSAGPTPNVVPAPVQLRFNGGGASGELEVSPGGFHAFGSPSPVAGITALSIVYTADVRVRVFALS